jgi:acetylornithine deacetylase
MMTDRPPRPETLEALKQLISFDTTSRNSNLALIDWAEAWLTGYGAQCERVFDETGKKANLWATFGPTSRPGWILSGHTDTVPVEGQDWSVPAHDLSEANGRYFGRGTCDMKGFLACCLGLAPAIATRPLDRPIHMAFSYDEEIGCVGVRSLLQELARRKIPLLGCVVGEPTMMQVCIGHKSKQALRVTVIGTPGHSSRAPEFVNAVEYGARLIVRLQEIGRRLAAGPQDVTYDTPHSTAHVGLAQGGTILNIVPELFSFDFEFRTVGADDPDVLADEIRRYAREVLLPEMRTTDARADIRFELLSAFPGVDTPPEHAVAQACKRFAGESDVIKVAFGTEGGLFQQIVGVPTVVCGPGSIAQAHRPDEFIEASQIVACEDFLHRLIEDCRGM